MKTRYTILFFLGIFPTMLKAQITGYVKDDKSERLKYATVVVHDTDGPSKILVQTTADSLGHISIPTANLLRKNIQLTFRAVGHLASSINLTNTPIAVDVGDIILKESQRELDEVTITASDMVKPDRQLLFPSKTMIRHSSNGYELLRHLNLTGVQIDVVKKSVSALGGGAVDLYINDKKASQADIVSLQPDEVTLVELIDAPGVRYETDGIEAAINFVVRRRYSGVVAGADLTNAVTTGYGNNFAYAKWNCKQSELAVNYSNSYANLTRRHTDQDDNYLFSDGHVVNLQKQGSNTYLAYAQHNVQLSYNLSAPRKYMFQVDLTGIFYDSKHRDNRQTVTETGKDPYHALSKPTEMYHAPSLDLYYKLFLPKGRQLTLSAYGTYISTDYTYRYTTFTDSENKNVISDYGYGSKGDRFSFIGEARYNFAIKKYYFLLGAKVQEAHTNNRYEGDNDKKVVMNTNSDYVYLQVSRRWKQLSGTFGLGVNYMHQGQDDASYDYWTVRPALNLIYKPLSELSVRYVGTLTPYVPSLASISAVRQQANDYDFSLGNPDLKPYRSLVNQLVLSYSAKRVSLESRTTFRNSNKALMDDVVRQSDGEGNEYWETMMDNQKSLSSFTERAIAAYSVIPNKLTLQGGIVYSSYHSRGNNYTHHHESLSGLAQADYMFGAWNIGAQWNSRSSSLLGETVSYSASASSLYASWRYKNLSLVLTWCSLFGSDKLMDQSKLTSETKQSSLKVYIPSMANMISLSVTWKISKGRNYSHAQKNISNTDVDNGIMKMP